MARFTIDPQAVLRIHNSLRASGNWNEVRLPFGLPIRGDRGCNATKLGTLLQEAMEMADETRIDRMVEILPGFQAPVIDAVSSAILAHYAVSPLDLSILTTASGRSVDVLTDDGGIIGFWHSQREPIATVTFHLTDGAVWEQSGDMRTIEIDQMLPQTALIGLPGTLLERVVSHPALDPLGLVISKAEIFDQNNSTIIEMHEYRPVQADGKTGERNP